ncbi:hypothetical protein [Undibacterium sp.]|uniref:hypothetical protein n=1 Tax=Undibacterium sp. TaxID=1914977 RepID=UPI00374DCAEB
MTIEKQQNDENEKNMPLAVVDKVSFGESRRRFTKTGIAASGVLVTLASRPALGCTVGVSPSVYCSGNVSGHGTSNTSHPGCPPNYWSGNCDHGWPSRCKTDTLFQSCFTNATSASPCFGWTLIQILDPQNNPKMSNGKVVKNKDGSIARFKDTQNGLASFLVAAYLNNASGKAPFLTQANIVEMHRTVYQTPTKVYVPTAGAKPMTPSILMTYLGGTWD